MITASKRFEGNPADRCPMTPSGYALELDLVKKGQQVKKPAFCHSPTVCLFVARFSRLRFQPNKSAFSR
jgi:hypothetical protein